MLLFPIIQQQPHPIIQQQPQQNIRKHLTIEPKNHAQINCKSAANHCKSKSCFSMLFGTLICTDLQLICTLQVTANQSLSTFKKLCKTRANHCKSRLRKNIEKRTLIWSPRGACLPTVAGAHPLAKTPRLSHSLLTTTPSRKPRAFRNLGSTAWGRKAQFFESWTCSFDATLL